MSESLIAGFISGGVTLIVCLINNAVQAEAVKAQQDKTIALIEYKISELTKKVEKHNNLIERMAIIERDLKTAFNLIDEVRDDVRDLRKTIS